MKKLLALGTALVLASGVLVALSRTAQNPGEQGYARSKKGTPIAALAKAGQKSLLVLKDQAPPLSVEPPPSTRQLEWVTSVLPTALVVRVTTVEPHLTAGTDWIESTVTATVEQVLKTPATLPLVQGQSVQFTQDGGDMDLSGVQIHAVLPWADGFNPQSEYLIFANATDDGNLVVNPFTAYRIGIASALVPLAKAGNPRSEIDVPLAVAAARIMAAVQGQPR